MKTLALLLLSTFAAAADGPQERFFQDLKNMGMARQKRCQFYQGANRDFSFYQIAFNGGDRKYARLRVRIPNALSPDAVYAPKVQLEDWADAMMEGTGMSRAPYYVFSGETLEQFYRSTRDLGDLRAKIEELKKIVGPVVPAEGDDSPCPELEPGSGGWQQIEVR